MRPTKKAKIQNRPYNLKKLHPGGLTRAAGAFMERIVGERPFAVKGKTQKVVGVFIPCLSVVVPFPGSLPTEPPSQAPPLTFLK
jgi:hypothetical protein